MEIGKKAGARCAKTPRMASCNSPCGPVPSRAQQRQIVRQVERDLSIRSPRGETPPRRPRRRHQNIHILCSIGGQARRSTSASRADAGITDPCSFSRVSSRASGPLLCVVASVGETIPCQSSSRRARACGSVGSTCLRKCASDRRRSTVNTSASHHSRPLPPGRNSPSSNRPEDARR